MANHDKVKVVAFDIYGTILLTDDPENACPVRGDFVNVAEELIKREITLITVSDNSTCLTIQDLRDSRLPPGLFSAHYQMGKNGKNFMPILDRYTLEPPQLLVVGDREDVDIAPARLLGCRVWHVPEYQISEKPFSFETILRDFFLAN